MLSFPLLAGAIIGFTDSFGFDTTFYSVNEDDGAVTVSVRVVAGQLDRDVVVQLSTVNDSAFGQSMLLG